MLYTIDNHNQIYIDNFTPAAFEAHSGKLDFNLKKYRVKTIKSGNILEYECYPLWKSPPLKRRKKESESKPSQRALNNKNAIKRVIRLINTNFTDSDTWATFTYSPDNLPGSYDEAKKNMTNYLRRLKRKLKKLGHPELKYIYVTEYDSDTREKIRIHHHIVLNVSDRDLLEKEWKHGARTHARRLQEDDNGYEGLARYITKDPRGKKRYTCSRNLKKPTVSVSDYKLSRKKAHSIAMNQDIAPRVFEKMNKNYRFLNLDVYVSEYISGVYLHAKMRRKE